MVQSIDNRAVYSAVNIHITKPEVNARSTNETTVVNDNGIYNSVKIDIDNPTINTEPKKVYDYPENNEVVTYNQLPINNVELPENFPISSAYYSETVIIPEEVGEKPQDSDITVIENNPDEEIDIPSVNYTTTEAEKGVSEDFDNKTTNIQFRASEQIQEKKTPEIVPAEEIKPQVDIAKVIDNLENPDFDIQAQQMEEISRKSIEDSKNAIPYIVKDVFGKLIEITNKDTTDLPAPTEKQVEIRRKIIANFIAAEVAKRDNKEVKLPYQLTEEEVNLANRITPMEQAERNKEYAIYTIGILSNVYIGEIQKETGNVVPFTDVPGMSDIVNALRDNPNPGVKTAAIDSLAYLARPEYKNELDTIFSIAQEDKNPIVARTAARAKQSLND